MLPLVATGFWTQSVADAVASDLEDCGGEADPKEKIWLLPMHLVGFNPFLRDWAKVVKGDLEHAP